MQKKHPLSVIKHISENSFLRLISALFIILSITLLIFQEHFIIPTFNSIQFSNIESEAKRTATHIRNSLNIFTYDNYIDVTDKFKTDISEIMLDFGLSKVRIFNSSGTILFSSEGHEIGDKNEHEYFYNIVSKGLIYSKVIHKENTTMEGDIAHTSVAEIYLPIFKDKFVGAFEIYYDISDQENSIANNNSALRICTTSIWIILATTFFLLIFKASALNIYRIENELALTKDKKWLESAITQKTHEIKATQIVSVHALASLAEHYDKTTGQHLERIQKYVQILLNYLSSHKTIYTEYINSHTSSYIKDVTLASLLHDIGKTAIPIEILIKTDKLTYEEFETIKNHTTIASTALMQANDIYKKEFGKDSYLALARDIALYHHEKWDGSGYPHGLKGQTIPLSARITAIADVYDALTSERPYKSAWTHEQAVDEIVNNSGTQFDPDLIMAFVACENEFQMISGT